jgi:hypothetical protein
VTLRTLTTSAHSCSQLSPRARPTVRKKNLTGFGL